MTPNFRINDDSGALSQYLSDWYGGNPSVNASCDDRHIVVWCDARPLPYLQQIYGQLYDEDGNAIGNNFLISEGAGAPLSPVVAMANNGDFVVVYEDPPRLYARLYDREGIPYGPPFRVDDTPSWQDNFCWYPAVDYDSSGKSVIVWEDHRDRPPGSYLGRIAMQRYNSSGVPIGQNQFLGVGIGGTNFGHIWHPDVAMNNSDRILVASMAITATGMFDILCWICDFNSHEPVPPFIVNALVQNFQQKATVASNGADFFVAWLEDYDGDWHCDIFGQRVSDEGSLLGSNFQLNQRTQPEQYFEWANVCYCSFGAYIIVWSDNREPDWNISAQLVRNDGTLIGDNVRINDWDEPFNYCHQCDPSVSANSQALFFVWMDNRRHKGSDIYGNLLPWSSFPVTDDPLALAYNSNRHLVRSPNSEELHLVYTRGGEVVYQYSSNGGTDWGLSVSIGEGEFPAIALASDNLPSVAWTDDAGGLWYRRQIQEDQWSQIYHLWNPTNPDDMRLNSSPSIAIHASDPNTVHVLVTRSGGSPPRGLHTVEDYTFTITQPTQGSFVLIEQVYGSLEEPLRSFPSIARCEVNNSLHATWQRVDTICYAVKPRNDPWVNWGPQFSDDGLQSAHPYVETYGDSVYVVWQHLDPSTQKEEVYRGARHISYSFGWTPFSQTAGLISLYPVNASGFFTVYDEEPTSDYPYDIYYKHSPYDDRINITSTAYNSLYPQSVARFCGDQKYLYTAWLEGDAAPYEIKFRKIQHQIHPDMAYISSPNGRVTPSPYMVARDNFIGGWQIPVDIGNTATSYEFPLVPGYAYKAKAVVYHEGSGPWSGRIKIDDNLQFVITYNANVPETLERWIPPVLYEDSILTISLSRITGDFAAIGPIYIYRYEYEGAGGGPMSQQSQPLHNTSIAVFPNPFTERLSIKLQIVGQQNTDLEIYDVMGRLVKQFDLPATEASTQVIWDGIDDHGRVVPQGVYFLRVDNLNSGGILCQKVLRVK